MNDTDFTEENYKRLLNLAKSRYRFCDYMETASEPLVVWRHDIDYSPNRALGLARIDAECGLSCIYHVMVTSRYYSILERETLDNLRMIAGLGHQIGLHFDIEVLGTDLTPDAEVILERIGFEKSILQDLLDIEPNSMSFHNTILNRERITDAQNVAGMINVNAQEVFQSYKYISDSNGIWRRDRLEDVLAEETHQRLHVLTHPVWWTPEAMSPAERLRRAIKGRARSGLNVYFDLMKQDGRYDEVLRQSGFDIEPLN